MMKTMKWWVAVVLGAVFGLCAGAQDPAIPYTLMQGWTLKRVPVSIVAGVARWTNTYQALAVTGIELIGTQSAAGSSTGTLTLTSTALTNPAVASWTVTTNTVTNIVASGVGNTASGYAQITNNLFSAYADVFVQTGAGTNAGTMLIKGYSPQ